MCRRFCGFIWVKLLRGFVKKMPFWCALMIMVQSVHAMENSQLGTKEKDLKEIVNDNMARMLYEATSLSMAGNSWLLRVLLATKVGSDLPYKGRTSMQLIQSIEREYNDHSWPFPSDYRRSIEKTKDCLKAYQKDCK
jgi:hypothetical protein